MMSAFSLSLFNGTQCALDILQPTLTSNGFRYTKNKKYYYIESVNGHFWFTIPVLRTLTRLRQT